MATASYIKMINGNMRANLKIISVPMTKKLNIGQSYTFCIQPRTGCNWAIVHNDKWYNEWEISNSGIYTITITPNENGSLIIYVQNNQNEQYHSCIRYDVE